MENKSFNMALRGTAYIKNNKIIEEIKEGENLILKFGENPEYPNGISVNYKEERIGEISNNICIIICERIKKYNSKYYCKLKEKIKYPVWKCIVCNQIHYKEINKCDKCKSELNKFEINGAIVNIIEELKNIC